MASTQHSTHSHRHAGFTFIELSIVLVMIALIMSGVLFGQDMIKSAKMKAVIEQLSSFDEAVLTFQAKYGGLPGDTRRAEGFGLSNGLCGEGSEGAAGCNGDGDGRMEDVDGGHVNTFSGEVQAFWRHLSKAELVEGNFEGDGDVLGEDFPNTEIEKGGIIPYSTRVSDKNYYAVGIKQGVLYGDGMTPTEALHIDGKIDDGEPDSGIVRVAGRKNLPVGILASIPPASTAGTTGACRITGSQADDENTPAVPNLYNTALEENVCNLQIRMGS